MTNILITGVKGFVGRNLASHLRQRKDVQLFEFHRDSTARELTAAATAADLVFHLAGVNRPDDPAEFERGNVALTAAPLRRARSEPA